MADDRVSAVVDRLLSNIPAACKVLEEEGLHNLAGQLRRDCDALRYWQERGGLGIETDVGPGAPVPKVAGEFVRPAGSGVEWNLDVEGEVVE